MTTRRGFLGRAGMVGGLFGASTLGLAGSPDKGRALEPLDPVTERLQAAIAAMPIDDSHCHPIGEKVGLIRFGGHNPKGGYDGRLAYPQKGFASAHLLLPFSHHT